MFCRSRISGGLITSDRRFSETRDGGSATTFSVSMSVFSLVKLFSCSAFPEHPKFRNTNIGKREPIRTIAVIPFDIIPESCYSFRTKNSTHFDCLLSVTLVGQDHPVVSFG